MELSWIRFVGGISESTPSIVLKEIANAHGVAYTGETNVNGAKFIYKLNNTKVPTISEPYDTVDDLRYIARFVNHSVKQWSKSTLMRAFTFIIPYIQDTKMRANITLLHKDITHHPRDRELIYEYGLQEPKYPHKFNACILYRTCGSYVVPIHSNINDIYYLAQLLSINEETLYDCALDSIKNATSNDLVAYLFSSTNHGGTGKTEKESTVIDYNKIPIIGACDGTPLPGSSSGIDVPTGRTIDNKVENTISSASVESYYNHLHDIKILQKNIKPSTHNSAISLAAIIYKIDISMSIDPIIEYRILEKYGVDEYQPDDGWFRHWYNNQREIFFLYNYYNPIFSRQFYTQQMLESILLRSGITDSENAYDLVSTQYPMDNFFESIMPNGTRGASLDGKYDHTIITHCNIASFESGEILSYGTMKEGFQYISIRECMDIFEYESYFSNPFKSHGIFSPFVISTLKYLLLSKKYTEHVNAERNDLYQIILDIELMHGMLLNKTTKKIKKIYDRAPKAEKEEICDLLHGLLRVGFAMRSDIGNDPVEDMLRIDILVTEKILQYDQSKERCVLGNKIDTLPLVIYMSGEFVPSTMEADGITIRDRMDMIKMGTNTGNVSSCIRLSSNWICSSAVHYMSLLKIPHGVDLSCLTHIT